MNKKQTKKDSRSLLAFIQFSVLLAIEIIFCFTPLGTLPALGPLSATLSHVPVIVTAVVMGAKWGSAMGFAFGACSFIYWTFVAGACGSLANTVLVLGGILVFFSSEYMAAVGAQKTIYAILGLTVLTNGIPEAVIGALVAAFVAVPVKRAVSKHFS